mgnify:CR=1 FL=1
MISTVKLVRRLSLRVTVEHPDDWTVRKVKRAAENAKLGSEVDWHVADAMGQRDDSIVYVGIGAEDPDDEGEDPVALSDVDLLGDDAEKRHRRSGEEDEDTGSALPVEDLGFGADEDE